MILPVIGQALVELTILLVRNVIRVPGPNRLGLVQLFILNVLLLDLLGLLLVFLILFLIIIIDVLNLWLVLIILTFLFLFCLGSFLILDFLLTLLLNGQFDWITNKLGVLLDNLLNLALCTPGKEIIN